MVSVDTRIRRSARRARERRAYIGSPGMVGLIGTEELSRLQVRHELEELQELLNDEIFNMSERFRRASAIRGSITLGQKRLFVKRLHMMSFDDTYRDYAPSTKLERTRMRIESLLELCHGDEALLLSEYAKALEKYFPIETWSKYFEWNPKLIEKTLKSGKKRKTIRHHMRYRTFEEEEE